MALTTVAKLNIYLGETSLNDAKTAAVANAIEFIQTYCNRTFDSTRYRRWVYADGKMVVLEDRPIIAVNRCMVGAQNVMSVSFVSTTADAASLASTEADARLRSMDGATETLTAADFTTYTSVDTLATYIDSLAGWTATKVIDDDAYAIKPMPPVDALNTTVYLEGPDDEIEGTGLDVAAGIVYLGSRYKGWIYVDYTAGYTTIPGGLEQIATEMAAALLKSSAISGTMQSERIGDYQYTVASGSSTSTSPGLGILSSYESRLDLYRKREL